MSVNAKLSIAAALAVITFGSAAYASDASEIYGGDAGRVSAGGFYAAQGASHVDQTKKSAKRSGWDAYAKAPSAASSIGSKSMLSPGSLDYEPDLNSH